MAVVSRRLSEHRRERCAKDDVQTLWYPRQPAGPASRQTPRARRLWSRPSANGSRQQRARVSPKSRLGEKLGYIARRWDGLQLFLADGRVEMDSNYVENLIRLVALNRKNALFAGHDEGTAASGWIASLIETAKLNGVNPHAWLKGTLEAIAAGHPNDRIDELLPWNFGRPST